MTKNNFSNFNKIEQSETSKSLSFNSKNKPNFNIGNDAKIDYNPKCNLLKANQILNENKQLKNGQSHTIETFSQNININKSCKTKTVDKQNILQTLEASKQINIQYEKVNVHDPGKDKPTLMRHNDFNIPAVNQTQGALQNLDRKSETVNSNSYNNGKNTLAIRNSSDHSLIKTNNNTTMNRNLISFNNNVSIMKIKQQTMTEI